MGVTAFSAGYRFFENSGQIVVNGETFFSFCRLFPTRCKDFAPPLNWTGLKRRSLTLYPTELRAHMVACLETAYISIPTFFCFVKLFFQKIF